MPIHLTSSIHPQCTILCKQRTPSYSLLCNVKVPWLIKNETQFPFVYSVNAPLWTALIRLPYYLHRQCTMLNQQCKSFSPSHCTLNAACFNSTIAIHLPLAQNRHWSMLNQQCKSSSPSHCTHRAPCLSLSTIPIHFPFAQNSQCTKLNQQCKFNFPSIYTDNAPCADSADQPPLPFTQSMHHALSTIQINLSYSIHRQSTIPYKQCKSTSPFLHPGIVPCFVSTPKAITCFNISISVIIIKTEHSVILMFIS